MPQYRSNRASRSKGQFVSSVGIDSKLIDLHCHLLPGLDDGAIDDETAIAMARLAVDDGIVTTACTPHMMPGVYNNVGSEVVDSVEQLSVILADANVPLMLVPGADVHVDPGLISGLRAGRVLTLAGSRYFLLEPPHHTAPPQLSRFCFDVMTAGYVPILTHPERLAWIENGYDLIQQLARSGVLMQLTGGSLLGHFGRRAQYWSERMLDEELVDLIASDGHDCRRRPPVLSAARDAVATRCGIATANRLVASNPLSILENVLPSELRRKDAWGRGA